MLALAAQLEVMLGILTFLVAGAFTKWIVTSFPQAFQPPRKNFQMALCARKVTEIEPFCYVAVDVKKGGTLVHPGRVNDPMYYLLVIRKRF